jgi:acetyl-CoA carboxylase biotin carboxyl carrier protein
MNIKDIEALAELMESKGLTLVEIEDDDAKIKMEREIKICAPAVAQAAPAASASVESSPVVQITGAPNSELNPVKDENFHVVKSPTVGVYYASSSPDGEDFVGIGSIVKKGDVLCIIEAMKLMNEITSDADGEIVEVCIGNGQVVEYGQPLFKIK